jgi:CRP-like cAMP-binding protein
MSISDSEETSLPRARSVQARTAHRAVKAFFKPYGLPDDTLDAVASRARARWWRRGSTCYRISRRRVSSRMVFLNEGCVREERPTGEVRLWAGGTAFGEWTGAKTGPFGATGTMVSSAAWGFLIPVADVNDLVVEHGDLLYVLARMGAEHNHLAEELYGVNRRPPVSRVASLLRYLASRTDPAYRARDAVGQMIVRVSSAGLIEGPTQADLADALALGRATVEKSLAQLRDCGALKKPMPGMRQNRLYEVEDSDVLREMALGT